MIELNIDFTAGALAHRRHYGGGKSQLIAKAVGIKPKVFPSVLDLTAGLGRDAFVLACLGCEVTMVERHPEVHQLLATALDRARVHASEKDAELLEILNRMTLIHQDGREYLQSHWPLTQQVIYLDPMFPPRSKSAAIKKEMILMHQMVGADEDCGALMQAALASTAHRIVVKRSKLAPTLAGPPPLVFAGSSSRFDVYPRKALDA